MKLPKSFRAGMPVQKVSQLDMLMANIPVVNSTHPENARQLKRSALSMIRQKQKSRKERVALYLGSASDVVSALLCGASTIFMVDMAYVDQDYLEICDRNMNVLASIGIRSERVAPQHPQAARAYLLSEIDSAVTTSREARIELIPALVGAADFAARELPNLERSWVDALYKRSDPELLMSAGSVDLVMAFGLNDMPVFLHMEHVVKPGGLTVSTEQEPTGKGSQLVPGVTFIQC